MYRHIVQYYETDMMGVTHHSNYIRFMEEARIQYLKELGLDYLRLEQDGIISPIVHVEFDYRKATTFGDLIEINVYPGEFTGIKLTLHYEMHNRMGELIGTGKSVNTFVDARMKPIRLKKDFPDVFELLTRNRREIL